VQRVGLAVVGFVFSSFLSPPLFSHSPVEEPREAAHLGSLPVCALITSGGFWRRKRERGVRERQDSSSLSSFVPSFVVVRRRTSLLRFRSIEDTQSEISLRSDSFG
jgi:hypothetical protein